MSLRISFFLSLTEAQIQARIKETGALKIDDRLPDRAPLHLVCILKGAYVFLADPGPAPIQREEAFGRSFMGKSRAYGKNKTSFRPGQKSQKDLGPLRGGRERP